MLEGSPIEIPEETQPEIIDLFQGSTPEIRNLLLMLFGDSFLPLNIMERVTTFETACTVLSIDEGPINALTFPETIDSYNVLAFIKLSIVIKALNEAWLAYLGNSDQRKYHLVPTMQNGVMTYVATTYVTISTTVPVCLLLSSEELARYLANQFTELLDDYYLGGSSDV